MGNYTREEILAMAEEEDVEFIRLQFTDMFGTLKNIAITARELPRALDNQCVVYGSDPVSGLRYFFNSPMASSAGKGCKTDL